MAQKADESYRTNSSDNNAVHYCSYCGTKLDIGARFCKQCGKMINNGAEKTAKAEKKEPHTYSNNEEYGKNQRKSQYEGSIHKCPNCGYVLDAFVAICPSCGYEIRDGKSTKAIEEFAIKLAQIESQKMPLFDEKKSILKTVFGRDLKNDDKEQELRDLFEEQKQKEKETLIINFAVPNTKEDILEFMLLAASNIDIKHETDETVRKAWRLKFEQVYQKAELFMGASDDFQQIKYIYDKKHKEIHNRRVKYILIGVGSFVGWLFLLGLLWNPLITSIIGGALILLTIFGIVMFRKK